MKQLFILATTVILAGAVNGQQSRYISVAGFTTQTAMPFAKFSGLFTGIFHPGAEIGYGKNFKVKAKHDWFAELKLAYFFHRFVQHGIPLYANMGYRYKISSRFMVQTAIGAGYMHSIPATAKFKLNDNGEYKNNKGIGRMQAMATYSIGGGYVLNPSSKKTITVFASYQQLIQMPFVKSYVPLLPYNSFVMGIKKQIR